MAKPRKPKAARGSAVGLPIYLGALGVGAVLIGVYMMSGSEEAEAPPAPRPQKPDRREGAKIFGEAFQLYQQKDMSGAAKRFEDYLRLEPRDVSALNNLGLVHTELAATEEAVKSFKRVLAINPGHADAYRRARAPQYALGSAESTRDPVTLRAPQQPRHRLRQGEAHGREPRCVRRGAAGESDARQRGEQPRARADHRAAAEVARGGGCAREAAGAGGGRAGPCEDAADARRGPGECEECGRGSVGCRDIAGAVACARRRAVGRRRDARAALGHRLRTVPLSLPVLFDPSVCISLFNPHRARPSATRHLDGRDPTPRPEIRRALELA